MSNGTEAKISVSQQREAQDWMDSLLNSTRFLKVAPQTIPQNRKGRNTAKFIV
jgi:hypothetical protein